MSRYTAEQEAFRARAPRPKRSSKPWRVRLYSPSGTQQTDHASSEAAYEKVIPERERAERGETEVTSIRVFQWLEDDWALYERITPARPTTTKSCD